MRQIVSIDFTSNDQNDQGHALDTQKGGVKCEPYP